MGLSPASSHGSFNGGTITDVLTILNQLGLEVDSEVVSGDYAIVRPSQITTRGDGSAIQRTEHDFSKYVALTSEGVWIEVHSAPPDGDLGNGSCVIWFDQTNGVGATKLMVKAKSADGTVKTGAVVLA